MAKYEYRCEQDGLLEVNRPIGTATPNWPCPACGAQMSRVFTAPMLSRASHTAMAAIDRSESTADTPDVVSQIPAKGARRRTPTAPANPALMRLPRP